MITIDMGNIANQVTGFEVIVDWMKNREYRILLDSGTYMYPSTTAFLALHAGKARLIDKEGITIC